MFTGLIEEIGQIVSIHRTQRALMLGISASVVLDDLNIGDSLSVNGVCLTVTKLSHAGCTMDVVPETVRRSTFEYAAVGQAVNLERAMRANGRFGGHVVSGHVDAVGVVAGVAQEDIARVLTVTATPRLLRYVVEKGSIAVDGVSLTVMDVAPNAFRVSVIPHTAAMTTLQRAQAGTKVNLEADVMAKYVEKLLGMASSVDDAGYKASESGEGLTIARMRELGY